MRLAARFPAVFFYAILGAILLFFLSPVIWLMLTSVKNYMDAFAMPPVFIFQPTFDNYINIFLLSNFMLAMWNSVLISVTASGLSVLLGAMIAYGLAFLQVKGRVKIITFILTVSVAPPIMLLLQTYYLGSQFQLIDTHGLLIAVYVLINLPFAILMLLTFFDEVPKEIREAALVEGCTDLSAFFRIVLPVTRGGMTATFILTILGVWNEFLIGLILSGKGTQTLQVTVTSFITFQGTEWGPLTAAGTFIMIPMLIFGLMVQKHLVKGMTLGAVK